MKKLLFTLIGLLASLTYADKVDCALETAAKLRAERRYAEAIAVLEAIMPDVPDERLRPFMNILAKPYWMEPQKAEEYLRSALLAPCSDPTDRARTYYQLGLVLQQQKMRDKAVDALKLALLETNAHPALLMSVYSSLSEIAEEEGNKLEALKHCRTALACGKRIRYKVDLSALEKRLVTLEKETNK